MRHSRHTSNYMRMEFVSLALFWSLWANIIAFADDVTLLTLIKAYIPYKERQVYDKCSRRMLLLSKRRALDYSGIARFCKTRCSMFPLHFLPFHEQISYYRSAPRLWNSMPMRHLCGLKATLRTLDILRKKTSIYKINDVILKIFYFKVSWAVPKILLRSAVLSKHLASHPDV